MIDRCIIADVNQLKQMVFFIHNMFNLVLTMQGQVKRIIEFFKIILAYKIHLIDVLHITIKFFCYCNHAKIIRKFCRQKPVEIFCS